MREWTQQRVVGKSVPHTNPMGLTGPGALQGDVLNRDVCGRYGGSDLNQGKQGDCAEIANSQEASPETDSGMGPPWRSSLAAWREYTKDHLLFSV